LPNSILQGSLVISERNFIEKFPSASGYRVFLMDAIPEGLARTLEDKGFEAVPAWRRLAEFSQVENTYLGIFQALGGLGLLLGSVGLAIVVLRNVMERRGELALLQAVGFERRKLRWLVLSEHWLLVLLGVVLGTGAALVAVWPQRAHGVPVLTLALLAAGGLFWSWLAAVAALRGPLLPALRNE
jgi:ABC-type antimicrobial peptide transport system permease subunit